MNANSFTGAMASPAGSCACGDGGATGGGHFTARVGTRGPILFDLRPAGALSGSDAGASGSGHGAAAGCVLSFGLAILDCAGKQGSQVTLQGIDLFFDLKGATELVGGDIR